MSANGGGAVPRVEARTAGLVMALVVVVLAVAWFLRAGEGRRSVAAADAAFARGDRVEAIVLARAAAEARCPWCAAPEAGFARLERIAKEAESRGDDATAVAAWRATRAASLGTVTIDPAPVRRAQADREIARFEHRIETAAVAGGAPPAPAASEERLRAALERSSVPSGTVFVLLTLGGALFLFGALRFVRRKLSVLDLATALVGGGVAIAAVLLF